MSNFERAALALVIALQIATLCAIGASFPVFPAWTDSFWSGWAQAVGTVAAIMGATRVARMQAEAQHKSALEIERRKSHSERRDALASVLPAVFEASTLGAEASMYVGHGVGDEKDVSPGVEEYFSRRYSEQKLRQASAGLKVARHKGLLDLELNLELANMQMFYDKLVDEVVACDLDWATKKNWTLRRQSIMGFSQAVSASMQAIFDEWERGGVK